MGGILNVLGCWTVVGPWSNEADDRTYVVEFRTPEGEARSYPSPIGPP